MKTPFTIPTSMQSFVLSLLSCILILASCKDQDCGAPCNLKKGKPKASYGPPLIHSPDAVPDSCKAMTMSYYESTKIVTLDLARLDTIEPQDTVLAVLDRDSALFVLESRKGDIFDETWQFSSADSLNGTATLIYRGGDSLSADGFLEGDLSYGGNDYELRKCIVGSYILGKVDSEELVTYDNLPHVGNTGKPRSNLNCDNAYGNTVIDLMVVYTDSARNASGGILGIEANILMSIEKANESFAKNGIPVRLNLNHIGEYEGYPAGLESKSLDLKSKLDSFIITDKNLAAERERFNADLYMVFVKNADTTYNGYASESKAVAVLRTQTPTKKYLFAHEIGHLIIGDYHADSTCLKIINGETRQTIMGNVKRIKRVPQYVFDGGNCSNSFLDEIIAGARLVSTNRCLMMVREALIQDYFQDNGIEPSNNTPDASVPLFSPQIYLRNEPDSLRIHLYDSQNPIPGTDNYLYVIVRNGSSRIVSGSLTAYQNCNAISSRMADFTAIGTVHDINIPQESIQIIELKIPAGTLGSEQCRFIAQFHKNKTPDALPDDKWAVEFVVNKNKVAGRASNKMILSKPSTGTSSNEFVRVDPCSMVNSIPYKKLIRDSIRIWFSPSPETQQTFLDAGGRLNYSFHADSTFNPINKEVVNSNPNSSLQEIIIPIPGRRLPKVFNRIRLFHFTVCPTRKAVNASYPVHIEQWDNKGITGAHTFILKTSNSPTQ